MSKKKTPPTTPKSIENPTSKQEQEYDSVLSVGKNFLDIFETMEEATIDGVSRQAGSLGFSSFLANKNTVVSQDSKNPTENLVGILASRFLGKFQTSLRELKKQVSSLYKFKPNQVSFHEITPNDGKVTLGTIYLTESVEDALIPEPSSSKTILIPANTILANLVLYPSLHQIFLELISYKDLLRKYAEGPRVLNKKQLEVASEFFMIINAMFMDSNVVVPLNVRALNFKPDDLSGLLQILEKLQLKHIHFMPLEKDYKYGSNNTIPPDKIAEINQLINKINSEISITSTLFSKRGSSLARQNQGIPESPASSPPNVSTNPTGPKEKR